MSWEIIGQECSEDGCHAPTFCEGKCRAHWMLQNMTREPR